MDTFDRIPIKEEAKNVLYRNRSACICMTLLIVAAELVLTSISLGFLTMVLTGVILVTGSFFFLNCWRDTPVAVSAAVSETFDNGFLRKMGGMLWMQLQVFLWSLLFIIPGIIKNYSFALTPYILADCPKVPAMEASRLSERMMRGHRLNYFVLELSFLGWFLLSAFTFGIVYVMYAGPYMELTKAGVYNELKQLALDNGVVSQAELDGEILV